MTSADVLLSLASTLSAHVGRAEATISFKAVGHGRLFARLRNGDGCTMRTAQRALDWFDENWPDDLAWPADVQRPSAAKRRRVA